MFVVIVVVVFNECGFLEYSVLPEFYQPFIHTTPERKMDSLVLQKKMTS